MASFVYYKFRSQKNESRIQFHGTGISVFDLKREILLANNFGKANDCDLALYDQQEQEYKDDTTIIPRSSSVIVSRLPAAHPGRGCAAHYLAGAEVRSSRPATAGSSMPFRGRLGPMSRRFDTHEPTKPASAPPTVSRPTRAGARAFERRGASETSSTPVSVAGDEADSIAAMFAATEHQWEETQEKMSHAARIPLTSTRGDAARKAYVPHSQVRQQDHTPRSTPPGYVCYRCGQKGHWIRDCPTNTDREFDNRPRIKRTTGIPRSFLKAVSQPTDGSVTAGVMITPEGSYVVAQPDAASWQKQTTRTKTLTEADVRAKAPSDASLACSLCSRLYREAVKTPCCGAVYCEECIQTHLLEHDFECPACHSKIPFLDKLVPEEAVRARVQAHIDKALADRRASSNGEKQLEPGSGTPTTASQASNGGLTDDIHGNEPTPEQQQLFPEPAQIQAQIGRVHTMLQNPALPQQARMQLQTQLPQLTGQLERARMVATLAEAALASASYGMNVPSMNVGCMVMSMGGYGNGMMSQPAWNPSEYRPQWTNPFPNQQPAGLDSAYQRLPVNNRRRGLKRDRPTDFLEVGGDGPANKVARYWE